MSKRTAKSKSAQRNQANREMFLAGAPKKRSRKAKVAVEPVAAVEVPVEVPVEPVAVEPVAVEPVAVEVAPVEVPTPRRSRKAKTVAAPVEVAAVPPVEAAPVVEITEIAKLTGPKLLAKFNEMVPTAQALGIKCHIHTSLFESRAKGTKQLTKLQAAIAQAQAVAQ